MKVLLKKDLKKVGKKGEIVDVSDGYGANFIIPQGYGVLYTQKALEERNEELRLEAIKVQEETKKAQEIAKQMEKVTFEYEAPIGNKGSMIGTISSKELKKAMKEKFNINIDKNDFVEHTLVNTFGLSHVKVQLYKNVYGIMNVLVKPKETKK